MKLIIAGGRSFNDYALLSQKLDFLLQNQTDIEIVSGGAKGADNLGERYAKERGLACTQFPAQWDKYGKRAGMIRNEHMAQYADALVAFWDGASVGTQHMIQYAKQQGLNVRVVRY